MAERGNAERHFARARGLREDAARMAEREPAGYPRAQRALDRPGRSRPDRRGVQGKRRVTASPFRLTGRRSPRKMTSVRPSVRHLEARQRRWQADVTDQLPALLAHLLSAEDCSGSPPRTHGVYLFSERGKPMYVGRTGKTERSIAKGRRHSNFRTRRAAHTHARHNEGTYAYRLALDSFADAGRAGERRELPTAPTPPSWSTSGSSASG
jgi:hypothetical protein